MKIKIFFDYSTESFQQTLNLKMFRLVIVLVVISTAYGLPAKYQAKDDGCDCGNYSIANNYE